MILTKTDFIEAEKNTDLVISNREDFQDFTLDLRIDRLFKRDDNLGNEFNELPINEWIDKALIELDWNELVIGPHDIFYALPKESISNNKAYLMQIYTKSSVARTGLSVQDVTLEGVILPREEFKHLVMLRTDGTSVRLHKGKSYHQLLVSDMFSPVYIDELAWLIERGDMKLSIGEKAQDLNDLRFHNHGVVLTMGEEAKLYNGGVLEPKKSSSGDFEPVSIKNGRYVESKRFFLTGSREHVEIPNGYVGFVKQNIYDAKTPASSSHPNAPLIGPKSIFQGSITFEHFSHSDMYLQTGQRLSDLQLFRLKNPIESGRKSTFYMQSVAQTTK